MIDERSSQTGRFVERIRAWPDAPWPTSDDLGAARPVMDRSGRLGLAVELPDVYADTSARVAFELDRTLGRLRGEEAGVRPRPDPAIDLADVTAQALRMIGALPPPGNAVGRQSIEVAGTRLGLAILDSGLLEITADTLSIGPASPRVRHNVARFVARANAGLHVVGLALEGDRLSLRARLPIAGLEPPVARAAASALAAMGPLVAAAAAALPPLVTLIDDRFQSTLEAASGGRSATTRHQPNTERSRP